MEQQNTAPTPATIMEIGSGFWASKVLLSALKFELFTVLASKGALTAAQIKKDFNWKCTERNVYDFLDTLTGFGFLSREGILETASYSNGRDTNVFLDKNKPSYIGGILEMMNDRLYEFWGNLEEGLLTGAPQNESKVGGNLFENLYNDTARLKGFVHAMTGAQLGGFIAFAEKFDFSKYKTLTDVGGSAAMLSLMVVQRHPDIACTTFDLPAIAPIANETIDQYGLSSSVKVVSGDFFTDAIPSADIVTMGNILHDWNEEIKLNLMQKAYDALPTGGAFVVIESIIDEQRNQNVFGMMMSINMLIETGDGFNFTFEDFKKWAKIIGFASTELLPLAGATSAAIAYK
jgi:hypothetical protein